MNSWTRSKLFLDLCRHMRDREFSEAEEIVEFLSSTVGKRLDALYEEEALVFGAAYSGAPIEMFKVLIAAGARVHAHDREEGLTALHLVSDMDIIQLLINAGADVNATDHRGETPLHKAAGEGNLIAVKYLVEKNAEVEARNKSGETPFYVATIYGNFEVAQFLLEQGADVNAVNGEGRTVIENMAYCGKLSAVQFLLQHGASVGAPLHYAAKRGHLEIVKCLIESGADVNARDSQGYTPLHFAFTYRYKAKTFFDDYDSDLACSNEMILYLLDAGADANAWGNTQDHALLHNAAAQGDAVLVNGLLDTGADEQVRNNVQGRVPLHYAAAQGDAIMVQRLIDTGADVNARDNIQGSTPLHLAAAEENKDTSDIVRALVQAGADINKKDYLGRTPLYVAASNKKSKLVKTLVELGADTDSTCEGMALGVRVVITN